MGLSPALGSHLENFMIVSNSEDKAIHFYFEKLSLFLVSSNWHFYQIICFIARILYRSLVCNVLY